MMYTVGGFVENVAAIFRQKGLKYLFVNRYNLLSTV